MNKSVNCGIVTVRYGVVGAEMMRRYVLCRGTASYKTFIALIY